MQKTIKTDRWLRFLIVAFCFLGTGYVLYFLTFGNYGEFDPQQRWLNQSTVPALSDFNIETSKTMTILHVRQPYCSCNPLADAHIAKTPEQVAEHWLTAAELQNTGFAVPATPMALIYQGNTLVYAGPYATGPLCSTDNSLIDDILNQKQQLAGPFLNGLVPACRCLT